MMTDPIADFCTRLRNANTNKRKQFTIPASKVKVGIAHVPVQYVAPCLLMNRGTACWSVSVVAACGMYSFLAQS